jgi:hypothetical protein
MATQGHEIGREYGILMVSLSMPMHCQVRCQGQTKKCTALSAFADVETRKFPPMAGEL